METNSESVRAARFGPFEADFRAGELCKNGRRMRLQNQPLQILALLVENPGEVVTREELRSKLWPADTFVDFEHGLNNAINRLREALGDSAENPRFIETLPKRGYRFIARLENVLPSTPVVTPAAEPTAQPRKTLLAVAAVVTLVLLLALIFSNRERFQDRSTGTLRKIAVLPLANLTGDRGQDYLADGLADALIAELAQVSELVVTSRTSTMRYKDARIPVSQIARELKVDAVVEGSLKRSGNHLTVTVQLIEASSDRHVWANVYEREPASVETLGRDVTRDLASSLGVSSGLRQQTRRSRPSLKPGVYNDYLQGLSYAGLQTLEDNDQATRLLEGVVAAEPDFAEGHAALSTAYLIRGNNLTPSEKQWHEKAFASVERALELDPELAQAYLARGQLLWSPNHQFAHERAVQEYRRALSLSPNLAEARHQLANVYNHIGLLDKAQEEIQKAVALDPLNTAARFRVGINLLYQGKYEESLSAIRDSRKFNPPFWVFQTSFVLFQLGKREEALEKATQFLEENPEDPGGQLAAFQALVAASKQDARAADIHVRQALEKGRGYHHFHHTAYILASTYSLLNQPASAMKYLEKAADEGFPCYPLFERDPNLNNLRSYPAFRDFMDRQKKQWERFRSTL